MFTTDENSYYTIHEIKDLLGLSEYEMPDLKPYLKGSYRFDLSENMRNHMKEKSISVREITVWYSWADITFALIEKERRQNGLS